MIAVKRKDRWLEMGADWHWGRSPSVFPDTEHANRVLKIISTWGIGEPANPKSAWQRYNLPIDGVEYYTLTKI